MKISTGSDHRGLHQRSVIGSALAELGHEWVDLGTMTEEPCDYPDIAKKLGQSVANGQTAMGILVCGTGIGMSIAANKVRGVRAALCVDEATAALSRQHNNANVLCLPGDNFDDDQLRAMVKTWLSSAHEGGRHERRVAKVIEMEAEF
jgi:ribose 5-phosphate isomerase B